MKKDLFSYSSLSPLREVEVSKSNSKLVHKTLKNKAVEKPVQQRKVFSRKLQIIT